MTAKTRNRTGRVNAGTAIVARVTSLVERCPGLSTDQIAEAIGIKREWAKNVLSFACRSGLIGSVRDSRTYTWHPAEQANRLNSSLQTERDRLHASLAAQKAARHAARNKEPLPDRPVQIHAAVNAPLPFVCTARNSVFALAADR